MGNNVQNNLGFFKSVTGTAVLNAIQARLCNVIKLIKFAPRFGSIKAILRYMLLITLVTSPLKIWIYAPSYKNESIEV